MAIDRDDALRKAEKLLRQGRLDGAIAEYEQVVDAHPDDIATASALGDLYGRAGKAPQAVAQFMRLGDHFLKEGVQAKAAASYRKVLKLDPGHEGALLQLVEACAQQGQLADAKTHLQAAVEKRKARGDQDGADTLAIRLAELDPNDFEARLQAAKIRVRTGKVVTADLMSLAQELDTRKRTSEAEELLEEVVKRDPGATEVSLRLAKAALARDEVARAKRFLPDTRGSKDPELLLTGGKILLKLDNLDAARDHLVRFLAAAPKAVEEVATLGEHLASPNARYAIVDLLVDQAAASGDFGKAARRLQGFLEKAPRHLAALLRLVEVCVDGDLDAALTAAQQELAEAYLDAAEPEKARVIAEDLLLRNPRSSTHKDRLRRVLVTLGEKDPDGIIAERLSMLDEDAFASEDSAPAKPVAAPLPPVAARAATRGRREPGRRRVPADQRDHGRYAGGPARDGCGRRGRRVRGQRCRRLERRAAGDGDAGARTRARARGRNRDRARCGRRRRRRAARRRVLRHARQGPAGHLGPAAGRSRGAQLPRRPDLRGGGDAQGSRRRVREGGARPALPVPLGAVAGTPLPEARHAARGGASGWTSRPRRRRRSSTSTARRSTSWPTRSRPPASTRGPCPCCSTWSPSRATIVTPEPGSSACRVSRRSG